MADPPPEHLKIGEFARMGNTNRRTLRYYEELGLLVPVTRSSGGFRHYQASDLHRLRLIQDLAELGLQLDRIGDLIHCAPGQDCWDASAPARNAWLERVRLALKQQEELIEARIQTLERQRQEIARAYKQLESCSPCELHPTPDNNFCNPCQHTGKGLPSLLKALFR